MTVSPAPAHRPSLSSTASVRRSTSPLDHAVGLGAFVEHADRVIVRRDENGRLAGERCRPASSGTPGRPCRGTRRVGSARGCRSQQCAESLPARSFSEASCSHASSNRQMRAQPHGFALPVQPAEDTAGVDGVQLARVSHQEDLRPGIPGLLDQGRRAAGWTPWRPRRRRPAGSGETATCPVRQRAGWLPGRGESRAVVGMSLRRRVSSASKNAQPGCRRPGRPTRTATSRRSPWPWQAPGPRTSALAAAGAKPDHGTGTELRFPGRLDRAEGGGLAGSGRTDDGVEPVAAEQDAGGGGPLVGVQIRACPGVCSSASDSMATAARTAGPPSSFLASMTTSSLARVVGVRVEAGAVEVEDAAGLRSGDPAAASAGTVYRYSLSGTDWASAAVATASIRALRSAGEWQRISAQTRSASARRFHRFQVARLAATRSRVREADGVDPVGR